MKRACILRKTNSPSTSSLTKTRFSSPVSGGHYKKVRGTSGWCWEKKLCRRKSGGTNDDVFPWRVTPECCVGGGDGRAASGTGEGGAEGSWVEPRRVRRVEPRRMRRVVVDRWCCCWCCSHRHGCCWE